MNKSLTNKTYFFAVILIFAILYLLPLTLSTAATSTAATTNISKLEVLNDKVELLQKINERLLQTVYWTLATLAAIFLGIVSVNLYFNISANKREIQSIKVDIETLTRNLVKAAELEIGEKNIAVLQKELERIKEELANLTTSEIKTSEAKVIDKTNVTIQHEIEKGAENTLNVAKNEILTHKAEIIKLMENSTKALDTATSSIAKIEKDISEFDVRVRELEVFKYSKEGRMGEIIGHVELLEHDLEKRRWNLKYRLPEILEAAKKTNLYPALAKKLRKLLDQVKEKEYEDIVKQILASITEKELDDIAK